MRLKKVCAVFAAAAMAVAPVAASANPAAALSLGAVQEAEGEAAGGRGWGGHALSPWIEGPNLDRRAAFDKTGKTE